MAERALQLEDNSQERDLIRQAVILIRSHARNSGIDDQATLHEVHTIAQRAENAKRIGTAYGDAIIHSYLAALQEKISPYLSPTIIPMISHMLDTGAQALGWPVVLRHLGSSLRRQGLDPLADPAFQILMRSLFIGEALGPEFTGERRANLIVATNLMFPQDGLRRPARRH